MTYRDDVHLPRCPRCTQDDEVHRNPSPGLHWLCGSCWTTFSGSQSEWAAMTDARQKWKQLTEHEERKEQTP